MGRSSRPMRQEPAERADLPAPGTAPAHPRAQRPANQVERLLSTPVAALLDLLPDAALLYDLDGIIIRVSPATRQLFALDAVAGYDTMPYPARVALLAPRSLDGQPLPQDDWHITRILRGETVTPAAPIVARVRGLDGAEHVLSYTGAPVRDEHGAIIGAVSIAHDITAQVEREEARTRLADEYRVLVEQAADAILVADLDGRYLEVNATGCELLGYTRAELLTMTIYDIVFPADRERLAGVEETLRAGGTHVGEWRLRRKDGTGVPAEISSRLLADGRCQAIVRDLSEHERLAGQLAAIFEALSDGVIVFDTAGKLLQMNPAARGMLGLEANPPAYTLPARDAQRYDVRDEQGRPMGAPEWPISRVLRGEVLAGANAEDVVITSQNGAIRQINVTGAPMRDAQGQIIGAVCVMHDVTARRRLEREAATRASELASVIESITDGVVVYDEQGAIRHINSAYRTLLALDADEMGRPIQRRGEAIAPRRPSGEPLPVDQWPATRIMRGEVLTGAQSLDVLVRAHDGRDILMNCAGAPVRDDQQRILGAVMVIRDVTERRGLERRTHEALAALLAMAEAAVAVPASPLALAADGTADAAAVPEPLARMAELTRQVTACQKVAITLLDDAERLVPITVVGVEPAEVEAWRQMLGGVPLMRFLPPEQVGQLRAGSAITLDLTPSPRREAAFGAIVALIAPMKIGERLIGILSLEAGKTAAEYTPDDVAVTAAVAQLAALVADRERLLRDRALAQANELALREANRRMDEFLGVASHELRTPLTTIKANLQLLERRTSQASADERRMEALPEVIQQLLGRANGAVQRQERLVSDLLDVSRIQEGRLELRLVAADLVPLVREIVDEMRTNHPERRIALTLGVPSVGVRMDADRVGQVLFNYLGNAIKYSARGTPLTVELAAAPDVVTVRVRDAGPGVPPGEQARIWDRFYRAPDVETRSGSGIGLGLGLYISRTIIERHGGSVGVESAPGQGATFWFTLPRDGAPTDDAPTDGAPDGGAQAGERAAGE